MSGEAKGGAASVHCAIDVILPAAYVSGGYREIRMHSPIVGAGLEIESAGGGHHQLDIAIVSIDAARTRQRSELHFRVAIMSVEIERAGEAGDVDLTVVRGNAQRRTKIVYLNP